MEARNLYQPGILTLYNAHTRKSYKIETNQGDSEVLLIDADTVYYRVDRTIWKSAIGPSELGNPNIVADDELVRAVHWALLGPPRPTDKK